jgi:hypothetical protein
LASRERNAREREAGREEVVNRGEKNKLRRTRKFVTVFDRVL